MHVFIIGAPAAGKMTIGQELSKLTGATLFFNHQSIDFALEIYQDFTEEMWEFVRSVNFSFLGTSARHHRSVILTGVTDFSNQYHLMYLKDIQDLLKLDKWDYDEVKIREKTILVREETSPEDLQGMALAQGIVTLKGGATSHGAVVARGMGKCCVTGCSEIKIDEINKTMTVGKYTLKEGDFISVSGHTGEIYLGKIPLKENSFSDELKEFVSWASEIKRMGVRMNADTPEDAEQGKAFGAKGIGLCRTEHMFFKHNKIWTIREFILSDRGEEKEKALKKLHNLQKEDFLNIFKILNGDEANIRLLDPPVHEFLPKTLEDKEKMVDFAKEVALKLSEVFEEINFSEPDFFEEYLEQFSHEEVDFVEILSVFKECNSFLEEFADYDDELILQKYIEVGDTDEIRIFLSAVFSFIALRKNLKKEDER